MKKAIVLAMGLCIINMVACYILFNKNSKAEGMYIECSNKVSHKVVETLDFKSIMYKFENIDNLRISNYSEGSDGSYNLKISYSGSKPEFLNLCNYISKINGFYKFKEIEVDKKQSINTAVVCFIQ